MARFHFVLAQGLRLRCQAGRSAQDRRPRYLGLSSTLEITPPLIFQRRTSRVGLRSPRILRRDALLAYSLRTLQRPRITSSRPPTMLRPFSRPPALVVFNCAHFCTTAIARNLRWFRYIRQHTPQQCDKCRSHSFRHLFRADESDDRNTHMQRRIANEISDNR